MASGAAFVVPGDLATPPPAGNAAFPRDEKKSASKTVTDTIIGEHEHTIIGYSLVKGIGDGEPIASERFTVGGHEWVLLFYPDGKRSSSTEGLGGAVGNVPHAGHHNGGGGGGQHFVFGGAHHEGPPAAPVFVPPPQQQLPFGAGGQRVALPLPLPVPGADRNGAAGAVGAPNQAAPPGGLPGGGQPAPGDPNQVQAMRAQAQPGAQMAMAPPPPQQQQQQQAAAAVMGYPQQAAQQQQQQMQRQQPPPQQQPQQVMQQQVAVQAAPMQQIVAQAVGQHGRREVTNDYAALFVALIGESDSPQGVVNTSDGRVVRAFHRFTLVDQRGGGHDLSKGRSRQQGAVKISCARQDPNARNCHGYRKFVKRSVLENPANGYLVADTIIIRYTIELVVSTGGALTRAPGPAAPKLPVIEVPQSSLGAELAALLESGESSDVKFKVEDEELGAHRIILAARSPVFAALLNSGMREGAEGVVVVGDVRAPVFRALLHFTYTDALPEELEGANLEVAMAQHLLVAADRFQLARLRRICERRLCETVEVDTVATTLSLAEQNHAEELKRVCLDFVSRNLQSVMLSEGYQHMVTSCPQLQAELLHVIAVAANERHAAATHRASRHAAHRVEYNADMAAENEARRVRQRRE